MAQELFKPQADLVDEELFVETAQTAATTAALWSLLAVSRTDAWLPTVILCGEHGAGTSTVARRFVRAARRNIACDALKEHLGLLDPNEGRSDAEAKAQESAWAERMVREHGGDCPGHCQPAAWLSDEMFGTMLEQAQREHPAIDLTMARRPDRDDGASWMWSWTWRSFGNEHHHPTRRTSLMLVEKAERILSVPPSRRRACLDMIDGLEERIGHRLGLVLIGTPALAEAVAEYRTTQVIRLDAMPNDSAFADVCAMIFGTQDTDEVDRLHRQSGGLIGRLVHIARLQGLTPPYGIPPEKILRLPAPAARQS